MDNLNQIRQKIGALAKKESGSLQSRDFSDDIYAIKNVQETFIRNSEMF